MKVATLGPAGTYAHQVALREYPNASIVLRETIEHVYEALAQEEISSAILPWKNNYSGKVEPTLVGLKRYPFLIFGEISIRVTHDLAGFGTLEEASILLAHPHSYLQCQKKLQALSLLCEYRAAKSNADSARLCQLLCDPTVIAIVSPMAAEIYKLPILKKNIQDAEDNQTRFLVLGKDPL